MNRMRLYHIWSLDAYHPRWIQMQCSHLTWGKDYPSVLSESVRGNLLNWILMRQLKRLQKLEHHHLCFVHLVLDIIHMMSIIYPVAMWVEEAVQSVLIKGFTIEMLELEHRGYLLPKAHIHPVLSARKIVKHAIIVLVTLAVRNSPTLHLHGWSSKQST